MTNLPEFLFTGSVMIASLLALWVVVVVPAALFAFFAAAWETVVEFTVGNRPAPKVNRKLTKENA